MVQEGLMAGSREGAPPTCEVRLSTPPSAWAVGGGGGGAGGEMPSALSPQCRDSVQTVEIDVALSVHPTQSVFEWPGRARLMPDLMMQQRVVERASPPRYRAEEPEKWREVAVFEVFSSICPLV